MELSVVGQRLLTWLYKANRTRATIKKYIARSAVYGSLIGLLVAAPILMASQIQQSYVGTEGSILFIGANRTLAEDNANLFWHNTSDYLKAPNIRIGDAGQVGTLRIYDSIAGGTGAYGLLSAGTNPGVTRFSGGQGSAATHNAFEFASLVRPSITNTYDIGEAALRWKDLYLSGILLLGTTATNAVAGSIVLPNNVSLYGVNAAANNTIHIIRLDTTNKVFIAPGNEDIRWGTPLVALGGGVAPTLGTIGGSGPGTAAQNSWMRVVDSAGAAFWVPVWK